MNTWRNASLAVTAVALMTLTTACGQDNGNSSPTSQSVGNAAAQQPAGSAYGSNGGYGSGDGYGNAIQECFGMNYGQAKNFAGEAGHASKPALGAKLTAIAHGCDA